MDRIDARVGAQDSRFVQTAWGLTCAGWAGLTLASGGIDLGRLPPGRGATGLMAALVSVPLVAAALLWGARRDQWSRPALMLAAALAALVGWSAASIAWAAAPDLAWLTTNRLALGLAAAVAGIALARRVPDAPTRLAIGVAVATIPMLAVALGGRILPDLLAPLVDTPRLNAPAGSPNTLALLAVFAVPGALVLASRPRWRAASASLLAGAFVVVALTGSRSGLLALVGAVAVALWLLPDRPAMIATLGAGVVGAALPAFVGLTASAFTREPILSPAAERRWIGLGFGLVVVLGLIAAAVLRGPLAPAAGRTAQLIDGTRGKLAIGLVAAAIGAVLLSTALASGRDAGPGAGRVLTANTNNRAEWWGEAWRGFLDAPLIGHGAGSFPLTHFAERDLPIENLQTRSAHQIVLGLMTELGLVGLLLGVLAVVAAAWGARRAGRQVGPALCLVVAFLIHAQFDLPDMSGAVVVVAFAAAGTVAGRATPLPAARPLGIVPVTLAGLVAAGCAASGVVVWSAARAADRARLAPPERTIALAAGAADRNPLSISALLALAHAYEVRGDGANARAAATRATRRQPENPSAWECLARVTDGADRDRALARWTALDPVRDPDVAPQCRPGG